MHPTTYKLYHAGRDLFLSLHMALDFLQRPANYSRLVSFALNARRAWTSFRYFSATLA